MSQSINPEKIERDVIVVGASAGGISAAQTMLSALPAKFPAIVGVVIHRGSVSSADWASVFFKEARMQIREPSGGELLKQGTIYLAPPNHHMVFEGGRVSLTQGPKQNFTRPAVDPLFESAAQSYGRRVVAVVLSGGGADGARGLVSVAACGGLAIVQKPSEAEVRWMPLNAIERDHVSAELGLQDLSDALFALAYGNEYQLHAPDVQPQS